MLGQAIGRRHQAVLELLAALLHFFSLFKHTRHAKNVLVPGGQKCSYFLYFLHAMMDAADTSECNVVA